MEDPKEAEKTTALHTCKNCENTFEGKFCTHCGQSVFEYERPFRFLVADFTGNLFAFDTRFWKSLKALTIQPGKLTKDFIDGKRARYMPPFRFFIFISFLFFLVFSSYLGKAVVVTDENKKEVYEAFKKSDSLKNKPAIKQIIDSVKIETNNKRFSLDIDHDTNTYTENSAEIEKLKVALITVMEHPKIYMNSFIKFVSWSLFLLMPVYAFILWLFFRKTMPYYYSHLIMAVNQHSFWFLILTIIFSLQYLLPERNTKPELFLLFLLPLHSFLGYKQLYKRSWFRSIFKSFGIAILYGLLLLIAMGIIFTFWVKSEFL